MKSVILFPYCPLPANTGAKVEMLKHLAVLAELGPCTILSAASRPVGCGWTAETVAQVRARGFNVILREEECPQRSWRQWFGIAYAALCKGLRLERAFGHSNPYHRYAFPADWFYRHTMDADIAVINYSYWAHLQSACPKAIALLDVWSDYMWEGWQQEILDLNLADLTIVISQEEEDVLNSRGVANTVWSPPFVSEGTFDDNDNIGLVGTSSKFNREGLNWLLQAGPLPFVLNVYGSVGSCLGDGYNVVKNYPDWSDPYRACGIVLITTAQGMGVQIKAIEALASGRAIVARRGAMRGIPSGDGAWIEVDSASEMLREAKRLQSNLTARNGQMASARAYYQRFLDAETLRKTLREAYASLVQ